MTDKNPLEDLYVDKDEINKERLRDALSGKIGIDRETGDAVFLAPYSEFSQIQKMLAYLLYRRATFDLGHLEEGDLGASAPEVEAATGIPEGTVRGTASESSLIDNDSSTGGYYIPEYGISDAISRIQEE